MYMVTGTDYVFARNSKTGEILYKRWLWFDQNIGRTLWLGQQSAGRLVAVLKVLSTFSMSARPARPRNHCPRIAALVRDDVSNGTEKPVRKLAE